MPVLGLCKDYQYHLIDLTLDTKVKTLDCRLQDLDIKVKTLDSRLRIPDTRVHTLGNRSGPLSQETTGSTGR